MKMKQEGVRGVSRRGFLGGVLSLGAFGGLRAFAVTPGSASYGAPNLRVGVISDIHVSYLPGAKERKPYDHGSGECFFETLRYFDAQKVDAVLIAGDLTNFGDLFELKAVSDIWKRVFPGNRRSDGEKVEPVIVYGNHDAVGFDFMHKKDYEGNPEKERQMLELSIFKDPAGAFETAFGEKWGDVFVKTVKGYAFVGAHWGFSDKVPAFLRAHRSELAGEKPFFFVQHQHPADTVYGTFAWGRDRGKTTEALAEFPNAVAFSGHSHYSLTDPHSIWQGAFTSIGTATLSHSGICGYGMRLENARSAVKSEEGAHAKPVSSGRQGMLMEVYDDRIVLARRSFPDKASLGADWVIPLSVAKSDKPYRYEEQANLMRAPEFPSDAKATVKRVKNGKLRRRGKEPVEEAQVCVSFTGVPGRDNPGRVFFYDVRALVDGQEVKLRRVLPEGYWKAPEQMAKTASCVFPLSDFPAGKAVTFEIRPLDAFLNAGRPIRCTFEGC